VLDSRVWQPWCEGGVHRITLDRCGCLTTSAHTCLHPPPQSHNGKRLVFKRTSACPRRSGYFQWCLIDLYVTRNNRQHRLCLAPLITFWQTRVSLSIAASAQPLGVMGDRIIAIIAGRSDLAASMSPSLPSSTARLIRSSSLYSHYWAYVTPIANPRAIRQGHW
jgi:hypothetical protein